MSDSTTTEWSHDVGGVKCPGCGEENCNPFEREETINDEHGHIDPVACEFCDVIFYVTAYYRPQFRFEAVAAEVSDGE